MRLNEHEQRVIKQVLQGIDPDARIFLFGSRANDQARGGDIDLLIESPHEMPLAKLAELRWKLMEALGEQKFDIVVASERNRHFVDTIRPKAVEIH